MKTIFARMTTMNDAIDAMSQVGVSINDMAGNIRPVSDIMKDLAGKWDGLTDAQRQQTAVSVAGKFQLTRFLALMNNFELATSATTTAINSQGSAMKEQEKYSDSLEARINRLDTAWNKFTLSMGNAVITDSLVGGIETLNSLATSVAKFVDKFGALGAIFGILGVATLALNSKFKTFATSMIFGTQGMTRMQLASAGLTAGMTRLGIASVGVGVAFRGLMASTGVGLLFVGIGFTIEKLIGAFAKAKKEQEEFQASLSKDTDALTKNKQETERLIDQYNGLTEAKKQAGNEWSGKQETQYLSVQTKLAELYPSLISYIDGSGQAHLKTKEEIDKEIESTNKLIEAKKLEAQADAQKNIRKAIGKKDDLKDKIDQTQAELDNPLKSVGFGENQQFVKKSEEDVKRLQSQLIIYKQQWSNAAQAVTSEVLKIANSYSKLQLDPNISQSVDKFFSSIDTSKLKPDELEAYAIQIGKASDELQNAYKNNDASAFDKAKQSIADLGQQMGATKQNVYGFALSYDDLKKAAEQGASAVFAGKDGIDGIDDSALDASGSVDGLTGSMNGLEGAVNGTTGALQGNISAAQILFGVTSEQMQQMENAILVVQALSGQENLNAQQKIMLAQATDILAKMYPQLNGKISENIDWLSTQGEVMGALNDISGHSAFTMINNQNSTTKSTIEQINQRIKGYQKEAQALEALMASIEGSYEERGMSGVKSKAYANASKRLAELNKLIAKAETSKAKVYYDSGVSTGDIKVDKPKGGKKGSDNKDDEPTPEEKRQAKIDDAKARADAKLKEQDELFKQSEARQKRFKEGSKEWIAEYNNQIAIIEKKNKITQDEVKEFKNLLKTEKFSKEQKAEVNAILQELTTSQLEYLNAIADTNDAIRESQINAKIAETEKLYNDQIAALQKKLDLMDAEEKKQDRLNELKQIEADIDKAKSDKRYEYIDKNGKVQLTYDKGRVAELEKEKADKQAEWKKEDERASLEKQIADAEVNRDKAIENLEKLQQTYLDKSYKDTADLKKIMTQFTKDLATTFKNGTVKVPKHHDGGIVGQGTGGSRLSSLVNDLFNVKPNEQIVKALKGEIMIPQANVPNFLANIGNLAGQLLSNQPAQSVNTGTTIILQNPVIQANNPLELLQGLSSITRKK